MDDKEKHDINNKLTAIMGYSELIEGDEENILSEKSKERLKRLRESVDQLRIIIKNIK